MHTAKIHRSSYGSRGFTLVELMIALAIGMLMSFGLFRVFANSSETYQALSQTAQQIENGRYAIETIRDDLRLAGYYGEYAFAPVAGTVLPDPCELANAATMRAAIAFYVQAYNNVAVSPLTCLNIANIVPGTDILVVRRANTATTALGSLVANEIYLQANSDPSNTANPILAFGPTAASFTLFKKDGFTPAEVRKYHVHIYFVSPCNVPSGSANCTAAADGGRPIPTLKRMSIALDGTGTLVRSVEPIAEGIEALQVDYGVDTDGDGMPNGNFLAAPAAVSAWSDVMALQIHVLARTLETTIGAADTKTYVLGTAGGVTPGGRFRRHVFTSEVRLVNPAGRRETP
jgi:type IV pilus assembly protein PilW